MQVNRDLTGTLGNQIHSFTDPYSLFKFCIFYELARCLSWIKTVPSTFQDVDFEES